MIRRHVTNLLWLVTCFVFIVSISFGLKQDKALALGGLNNRFDRISNSAAGATTIHAFGFDITEPAVTLGSIEFEFCSNDPLPNTACTAPVGLDVAGINLTQSGNTGFSVHANTTANNLILTRFPALPSSVSSIYQLADVINPSNPGSYFVRLQTYSSTDATGSSIEDGGLVFAITSGVNVTAEVPPYLRFCTSVTITAFDCASATSFLIDMGEFSTITPSRASSEMVVATNGESGYTVTMTGTTLISGNNVIPALGSPASSSPGTSQFGINLRQNFNPAIGADPAGPGTGNITAGYGTTDQYKYANGDVIASSPGSSDNRKYTLSYVTNISNTQAAGVYATTLTFICLANF